jgi:excisionase family DNA binding protein
VANIDVEKLREAIAEGDEPLLTVAEVARMYSVPRSWVYQRAERGDLPSVRLGKCRRFIGRELREWFARQRAGAR